MNNVQYRWLLAQLILLTTLAMLVSGGGLVLWLEEALPLPLVGGGLLLLAPLMALPFARPLLRPRRQVEHDLALLRAEQEQWRQQNQELQRRLEEAGQVVAKSEGEPPREDQAPSGGQPEAAELLGQQAHMTQIDALREELTQCRDNWVSSQNAVQRQLLEIVELTGRNDRQNEQLAASRAAERQCRDALERLQGPWEEAQAENGRLTEALATAQAEWSQREEEQSTIRANYSRQVEGLHVELERCSRRLVQAEEEHRAPVAALQAELERCTNRLSAAEEEHRGQVAALQAELERCTNRLSVAEEGHEEQVEALHGELERCASHLRETEAAYGGQMERLKTQLVQYSNQLVTLRAEYGRLEESQQAEAAGHADQLAEVIRQRDDLLHRWQAEQTSLAAVDGALAQSRQEVESLQRTLTQQQMEMNTVTTALQRQSGQAEEMAAALGAVQRALLARNESQAAAELALEQGNRRWEQGQRELQGQRQAWSDCSAALALCREEVETVRSALARLERSHDLLEEEMQALQNGLARQVLLFYLDRQGALIRVNDHFCRVTRFSREEVTGMPLADLGMMFGFFDRFTEAAQQPWQGEVQGKDREGNPLYLDLVILPLQGGDERFAFVAVATDITRWRQAEAHHTLLQECVRHHPGPICTLDGAGRLLALNPPAEPLLPLLAGLAPSLNPLALSAHPAMRMNSRGGPGLIVVQEEQSFSFTPVEVQESGGQFLFGQEITYQLTLEKRWKNERDRFRQVVDTMAEGLYQTNMTGELTFLSSAGERLLGWSRDEVAGKIAHDVFQCQTPYGHNTSREECPANQCLRHGGVVQSEDAVLIRKNGLPLPVSCVCAPIWEGERIVGSMTLFQDISPKRQIAQEIRQARDVALEISRLKSEFLANMSHEIRTPMNGVIGMAGLLLDSKLNKEQKEMATTIKDSAEAFMTVITDILDFATLETGRLEFDNNEFNLLKVVEGVAELVAPQAHRKGLTLLTELSSEIPVPVRGDPARLRQVLLNLVGNAVKFTKKGEVTIRVTLEERSLQQISVKFTVIDTGIGIAKESRHRLFQPFSQVEGSSTRHLGGSGLGLSIASRLVELMGGEIGLESKRGKGSSFWFTVPLALSSVQAGEAGRQNQGLDHFQGSRVLVVDRNQTSQTLLLNDLLQWQMKGTAVDSPEEAIAYLNHEVAAGMRCHLLIVDCSVTLEESIALAGKVRGIPALADLHLLLITSSNDPNQLAAIRQGGYHGHLLRPFSREQLAEALLGLLPSPQGPSRPENSRQELPLAAPGGNTEAPAVLLAEDNEVNRELSQMLLHQLGYSVHAVGNGRDAIQAVRSTSYDVVLMDCQMPWLNGFEATRAIRLLEMTLHRGRIPIIALTANATWGSAEEYHDMGMDDYLIKPLSLELLKDKLEKWLPKKESFVSVAGAGATPQ